MSKTFTLDDLILFAYHEAGEEKTGEIMKALNENEEFLAEYAAINEMMHELDNLREDPSEISVSNILNYSKALNIFKFKPAVNTGVFIMN